MPTLQDAAPADQQANIQRVLAACGVAGPLIFTVVVAILGFIRPEYSHASQLVSELGEPGAPYAVVMNLFGFILFGLLMIAFAVGLHRGIIEGKGSWIGPALLAIAGLGLVGVGVFPCDPGCPDQPQTLVGRIHHPALTLTISFSLMLAPLFFGYRMGKDGRWGKGYQRFSFVIPILIVVLFVLAPSALAPSLGRGWTQRLFFWTPFLWVFIVSVRLFRLSTS